MLTVMAILRAQPTMDMIRRADCGTLGVIPAGERPDRRLIDYC